MSYKNRRYIIMTAEEKEYRQNLIKEIIQKVDRLSEERRSDFEIMLNYFENLSTKDNQQIL